MSAQACPLHQFRQDLRLFPPREDAGDRRHMIYDPKTDLSYFLGTAELLVAQLFDGQRSLKDIADYLAQEHGKTLSLEKLASYEHKLTQLGLLSDPLKKTRKKRLDPAIGISYGPLKTFLMIPVLRINPAPLLDMLYRHCRWLCSPEFALFGMLAIFVALACLWNNPHRFWQDAKAVYGGNASWLLWHYPVVVVSIFFHEVGHALSCRHYRVRITDFGIAVYLLLAMGWARPLQGDWDAIKKNQRIVSIVMGVYASLFFAAVGVFLWQGTEILKNAGLLLGAEVLAFGHTIGIVMAVSSTIALIPTLLPIFNGDTYLAITELSGIPRLRQRAFRYLKDLGNDHPHEEHLSLRRKVLYWLTIVGTVVGWVVVWVLLVQFMLSIYHWLASSKAFA